MTGQLILAAEARGVWPKTEWKDKADLPLEHQIEAIVSGLEALADRALEVEAKRREDERRYWEEQNRREELRRREKSEANQWRRLRALAIRSEEAERLERFIGELKLRASCAGDDQAEVDSWIMWAERKLEAWDPRRRSVAALMRYVRAASDQDTDETD